ncbi:MAG: Zn-dependent protease [Gammaproteobacteria bacterium]
MTDLLFQGQIGLFSVILFAIVFSLTFHEFGHAAMAKWLGDDTAERAGRLTLNPVAHIDPLGLLMVVMVGFGYARPVPVDTRRLKGRWADAAVSFAGPGMNFILAVVFVNLLVWSEQSEGWIAGNQAAMTMFSFLARINILLMLFNLIPLGPLDGHHIVQSFLPHNLSMRYRAFNDRFGNGVFILLIVLSVLGVPIFASLVDLSDRLLPLLSIM